VKAWHGLWGVQFSLQTAGLTPVLHVNGEGQSSSLPHVIVQRNTPTSACTHFESLVGANPQSESSGSVGFAQFLELNWLLATQVLDRREHMSDVVPSMLVAFATVAAYGSAPGKQVVGAPSAVSPFFQKQK
jgi:hypothetical protein